MQEHPTQDSLNPLEPDDPKPKAQGIAQGTDPRLEEVTSLPGLVSTVVTPFEEYRGGGLDPHPLDSYQMDESKPESQKNAENHKNMRMFLFLAGVYFFANFGCIFFSFSSPSFVGK